MKFALLCAQLGAAEIMIPFVALQLFAINGKSGCGYGKFPFCKFPDLIKQPHIALMKDECHSTTKCVCKILVEGGEDIFDPHFRIGYSMLCQIKKNDKNDIKYHFHKDMHTCNPIKGIVDCTECAVKECIEQIDETQIKQDSWSAIMADANALTHNMEDQYKELDPSSLSGKVILAFAPRLNSFKNFCKEWVKTDRCQEIKRDETKDIEEDPNWDNRQIKNEDCFCETKVSWAGDYIVDARSSNSKWVAQRAEQLKAWRAAQNAQKALTKEEKEARDKENDEIRRGLAEEAEIDTESKREDRGLEKVESKRKEYRKLLKTLRYDYEHYRYKVNHYSPSWENTRFLYPAVVAYIKYGYNIPWVDLLGVDISHPLFVKRVRESLISLRDNDLFHDEDFNVLEKCFYQIYPKGYIADTKVSWNEEENACHADVTKILNCIDGKITGESLDKLLTAVNRKWRENFIVSKLEGLQGDKVCFFSEPIKGLKKIKDRVMEGLNKNKDRVKNDNSGLEKMEIETIEDLINQGDKQAIEEYIASLKAGKGKVEIQFGDSI